MSDSLENAIADIRSKISEHVDALRQDEHWREILKLQSGLTVLEGLCGKPATQLSALLGVEQANDIPKIEKWEFAGMLPLDAAKKFLRMVVAKQKAATLDEILKALEDGGLKANREDLRISLTRSTYEIYKVSDDLYGLLDSFPHVRTNRGKKKATAGEAAEPEASTGELAEPQLAPTGTDQ